MDKIVVGAFELYPAERMLCAAGKPLELGARAFDLLLVLVENHGRLVTKATLIDRVWRRVIVDENNLPAQIASLRRVLGAGAISTVPGYGYRLDLEVSAPTVAAGIVAPVAKPDPREPARPPVPRHIWPARLGPLIGRDEDLRAVQDALGRARLVTVVGTAGVGKTRLAQEIFARAAGKPEAALAWVSLESVDGAQHVPAAIAYALGIALPDGIDGFTALCQALAQASLLLILDGVEHLDGEFAAGLAGLVARTQRVRLLMTSQAPLGLSGETVYRLSVLPVPEPGTPQAEAARYAAVEFFAMRATEADQRFALTAASTPLAAEICRRLDGNPLALELAAARVPALGLASLLERLDDRFRLLKNTGHSTDPRHGVLQAAFDWSHGLLTPAEQRVFNRLGTFAGSFSLNAAAHCVADEAIDTCEAIDLIGRLVDRSLVTVLSENPLRYTLLETARLYALDRLAAGNELQSARARMAATMLNVLDQAYQEYWSADEAIWLSQYEPELDNVRAAIEWAMENDRALGVALYGSAWPLLVETDRHAEGRAAYSRAVALLSVGLPPARIGRFWEAIATCDSTRQYDRARYAAELAAAAHAAAGDVRSRYYSLLQLALNWRDDGASARTVFESARQLEDPGWPARLLAHGAMTEGALLMSGGQFVEARAAYRRALSLALTTSERQAFEATVNIVELDIACGATDAALQLGRPLALSLRHSGRRETRFELLVMIFSALLLTCETGEARAIGAELYELALRLDPGRLYTVLDAMAYLACQDGRHDSAARIAACANAAHEAHGQQRRRPAEEQMRTAVAAILERELGPHWLPAAAGAGRPLQEAAACSLALGLDA